LIEKHEFDANSISMNRFTVNRSAVADDIVAIIDQPHDEDTTGPSAASEPRSPQHAYTARNESMGLIPPVQTKTKRSKRSKKYGATNDNGNHTNLTLGASFLVSVQSVNLRLLKPDLYLE